ncbi:MAG: ComF family protein [Treponema sp.]|nr:ComF family protein [Treponema sp.]
MNQLWYYLREYFFPRGCGICAKTLFSKEEAWYGLCGECMQKLLAANADTSVNAGTSGNADTSAKSAPGRCDLCGRPLISEINRCLPCRGITETEMPVYDRLISLYPYTGNYQKLLETFKFKKSPGAGNFLAVQLLEALKLLPVSDPDNIILVPVPPRPGKIRKTGWDQIVMLAKLVKRSNKKTIICRCLKRQKSLSQKKLDRRDRRTNLMGRILVKKKAPAECVLFDDVITTGSTMNACAAALKQAGAQKVYGICLFYD